MLCTLAGCLPHWPLQPEEDLDHLMLQSTGMSHTLTSALSLANAHVDQALCRLASCLLQSLLQAEDSPEQNLLLGMVKAHTDMLSACKPSSVSAVQVPCASASFLLQWLSQPEEDLEQHLLLGTHMSNRLRVLADARGNVSGTQGLVDEFTDL